jgi:small-conductance mechanosensitive channel
MIKLFIVTWITVQFVGTLGAYAQTATTSESQKVSAPGYPVTLGDQTLFDIRDIPGLPAEQRAKAIVERIQKIVEDPEIPVSTVTTSTYKQPITLITAGNALIMAVVDEDAVGEARTREQLAKEYAERLRLAIEKYRKDHRLAAILYGVLYTCLLTAALVTVLILLRKLQYRIDQRILRDIARTKGVQIQSFEIIRKEQVRAVLMGAVKFIRFFLILLILYVYVHTELSFFPWTRPIARRVLDYVLVPLAAIGRGVVGQIPSILFIVILAVIARYILKLLKLFFSGIERGTIKVSGFYPEWAKTTYKIVSFLVIAFFVVVAFPYIPGSESPAFKGISIFIGVLFSLGSQSWISNVMAGFTLTYRRAYKVGDRVKIADFTGDVLETRLLVTTLRTIKNEEIVVPNSMILNSHVINYSTEAKEKGLILHTPVTIGYDAPWRQIHALLLMAAEKTPELLREPPPFVLQKSLDDNYVTYELNVYTDNPQRMAGIYSELHKNIQDVFNEYGVQIMSPAYRFDPERPKIVPKEKWYAPPAKPPDDSETNV